MDLWIWHLVKMIWPGNQLGSLICDLFEIILAMQMACHIAKHCVVALLLKTIVTNFSEIYSKILPNKLCPILLVKECFMT